VNAVAGPFDALAATCDDGLPRTDASDATTPGVRR
jgi:hypothetical protein